MDKDNLPNNNDFNAPKIAQAVGKHDQDIIDIRKRIVELESKFGSHEKIAETLSQTATKQIKMEEMFASVFRKLVEKDSKIKTAIEDIIKKSDRDTVKLFWKKFGFATWSAIVFILGVIITVVIQNLLKK